MARKKAAPKAPVPRTAAKVMHDLCTTFGSHCATLMSAQDKVSGLGCGVPRSLRPDRPIGEPGWQDDWLIVSVEIRVEPSDSGETVWDTVYLNGVSHGNRWGAIQEWTRLCQPLFAQAAAMLVAEQSATAEQPAKAG